MAATKGKGKKANAAAAAAPAAETPAGDAEDTPKTGIYGGEGVKVS